MVRFLTEDYRDLELASDMEFELTIDNPMFDYDKIPSSFSTQIGFPAGPMNREVFGYVPAMMSEPSVKTLPVKILIDGIQILSGKLEYDGMEDERLNYTFTSEPLGEFWQKKIWESPILPFSTEDRAFLAFFQDGKKRPECSFPIMVNEPDATKFSPEKYRNKDLRYLSNRVKPGAYPQALYTIVNPVVPVSILLEKIPGLEIQEECSELLGLLAIVGRYQKFSGKPFGLYARYVDPDNIPIPEESWTDIADYLPDISFVDLLKGISEIFCASIFANNGRIRLIPNMKILRAENPLYLDDKVSDIFSSESVEQTSYVFGFSDEKDYDKKKTEADVENGVVATVTSEAPGILVESFTSEDYTAVYCTNTGDVYSGRHGGGSNPKEWDCACDLVSRDAGDVKTSVPKKDAPVFDNKCKFYLVKSIPQRYYDKSSKDKCRNVTAAIYVPMASGAERDNKVYIGVLYANQLIDHGYFEPVTKMDTRFWGEYSLRPKALYEKYHRAFAEWLAKARQQVSVDLNLSAGDISNFDISNAVYFRGRTWIAKKISFTFRADSGIISASGDFVSL